MDTISREFDKAWAQFQTLNSLRLAEETLESEWTRGRSEYLAFLIPIEDADVRSYAARAVGRISAIAGVASYPERYWHITVKGLGFQTEGAARPDEISEADIERVRAAARPIFAEMRAFQVRAGRIGLFPEVVIVEVWDSLPVRELNCTLLERVPDLMRSPFDGSGFLPHISIARFTSSDGLAELKQGIAAGRKNEAGPVFAVHHVDLIRAHLSAQAPTFELIERYRLRAP